MEGVEKLVDASAVGFAMHALYEQLVARVEDPVSRDAVFADDNRAE